MSSGRAARCHASPMLQRSVAVHVSGFGPCLHVGSAYSSRIVVLATTLHTRSLPCRAVLVGGALTAGPPSVDKCLGVFRSLHNGTLPAGTIVSACPSTAGVLPAQWVAAHAEAHTCRHQHSARRAIAACCLLSRKKATASTYAWRQALAPCAAQSAAPRGLPIVHGMSKYSLHHACLHAQVCPSDAAIDTWLAAGKYPISITSVFDLGAVPSNLAVLFTRVRRGQRCGRAALLPACSHEAAAGSVHVRTLEQALKAEQVVHAPHSLVVHQIHSPLGACEAHPHACCGLALLPWHAQQTIPTACETCGPPLTADHDALHHPRHPAGRRRHR